MQAAWRVISADPHTAETPKGSSWSVWKPSCRLIGFPQSPGNTWCLHGNCSLLFYLEKVFVHHTSHIVRYGEMQCWGILTASRFSFPSISVDVAAVFSDLNSIFVTERSLNLIFLFFFCIAKPLPANNNNNNKRCLMSLHYCSERSAGLNCPSCLFHGNLAELRQGLALTPNHGINSFRLFNPHRGVGTWLQTGAESGVTHWKGAQVPGSEQHLLSAAQAGTFRRWTPRGCICLSNELAKWISTTHFASVTQLLHPQVALMICFS